jgi:hypothetical protein
MRRSFRERVILALSILVAALPFFFGLVRRLETGYDFRLLWMALASLVGAAGIMVIGKGHGKRRVLARSAATFVSAMLFTGMAGLLLGATSAAGVWGIGFVFGACWAASYALHALSRPRHPGS